LNANDTQAALEFLINPPPPGGASPLAVVVPTDDGSEAIVRMPATLARIQRLKEVKRKIQDRKNEKEKREQQAGKASDKSQTQTDLLNLSPTLGPTADFAEQATTSLPLIDWQ
jgi:hypothetical protein